MCSVEKAKKQETVDFQTRVKELFKGYRVLDVQVFEENVYEDNQKTGIQFTLDNGDKVDVYLDFDEYDLVVEEHK